MRILGFEFGRKAASAVPVSSSRGWFPLIREPYAGAWQKNDEWTADTVLCNPWVYACVTLISSDIAKMPFNLTRMTQSGIRETVRNDARGAVLKRPNGYQNHIQFKQWWIASKLIRGNTYVLKERDPTGRVVRLYVLDPAKVTVLVSADGQVLYQCAADNLGNAEPVTIPASEIIHDRMNCLFHPLVGISPLYASGQSAWQGLEIQRDSSTFFGNAAAPGGILTAPGAISNEAASRLKAHWDGSYKGTNAGKVAVLGDGLQFSPIRMSASDSQTIEQLRWTAEPICATFHVPAYKVGAAPPPAYNNIEALTQAYYDDCLQIHIEDMELCLDEGLELPEGMGTELDLSVLIRMDTATQIDTLTKAVSGTILTPNEARHRMNLPSLPGGDTVYSQVQNYSLGALAERDATHPLVVPVEPPPTAPEPGLPVEDELDDEAKALVLTMIFEKELASAQY